jgi:hypothetical protein
MRTAASVVIALLTVACASTAAENALIARNGYLLLTGERLQLFETGAARDARDPEACVQLLRNGRLQARGDHLPDGRVQVTGSEMLPRGGWDDAVEVRSGRDRASGDICGGHYIFVSSITATGN